MHDDILNILSFGKFCNIFVPFGKSATDLYQVATFRFDVHCAGGRFKISECSALATQILPALARENSVSCRLSVARPLAFDASFKMFSSYDLFS